MKKRTILLLLLIFVALFCGCNAADHQRTPQITVAVLDHDHISFDDPVRWVDYNSDVTYTLLADIGYDILSVDYENYKLERQSNTYTLTLYDVKVPTRVTLQVQKAEATICYHTSGAILEGTDEDFYYENYNLTYILRANTSLGADNLTYEGHTLVGWNTKADMTGQTIGLGSRVTIPEDTNYLDLYAQWAAWSDADDFTYTKHGSYIELTGYTGDDDTVVIPGIIDGLPVTMIGSGSFENCGATTVILPNTIETVAQEAFKSSKLQEICFYDNLMEIYDDSFVDCPDFSTVRINASHLPCYVDRSRQCHYADKIDMLILSLEGEKPRMVFFAGSSMWFSLDGGQVEEYFGGKYTPVNIALNGFYSGTAQFEVLKNYLREGDVFIHAPEASGDYQLLTTDEMTQNMFTCFELNYDLFADADIRNMTGVFAAYTEYNQVRQELPQTEYDARQTNMWIDQYGCIPFTRPASNGDEDLLDTAYLGFDLLTDDAIARLNGYYQQIEAITGNPVMFGFAPLNYDGLSEEDQNPARWQEFEDVLRSSLQHISVINTMNDVVLRGSNFYYTDFHLNSEATTIHTQILCQGIEKALQEVTAP